MKVADNSVAAVVLKLPNHGSLGIFRSLGRLGVKVYGVDADPGNPVFKSRYCSDRILWNIETMSRQDSLRFLRDLAARIGGHPVLIPNGDATALLISDHADELSQHFRLQVPPSAVFRGLSDKREMYFLAKKHGVPTAETIFPRSRQDVMDFLDSGHASFPLMLKGKSSWLQQQRTGVRMVIVSSAKELLEKYDLLEDPSAPNLMIQEYIPGGDDSVWMLNGYFNQHSDCLIGITGRKLRQCPVYAGATSLGICLENEFVDRTTRAFMKAVGYKGILDLGFRFDSRNGQYKLLDVNPRVGATFRLFVADNGLDVVRALYLDVTGQPVPPAEPRWGRKWLVENDDVVSFHNYRKDGKITFWEWVRSMRGVEECAWFAADDLGPFVATVLDFGRRFFSWIKNEALQAKDKEDILKRGKTIYVKPQTETADTASSDPLRFEEEKKSVDAYFTADSSAWNEIYQKEDVWSVIHQDRRSIALRYFRELSLPQDARILEIGCGAGMTSVDMARCGYTVEAVDSVKAMIDLTRQNALKFGVEEQIHAGVMDVFNLQFPDQTFDLVIALGVVPWLADSTRALKEISRVLAPGGYVLISADNYWRLIHLLDPVEFPPLTGLKERPRLRLFLGKAKLREFSSIPRAKRHTVAEFDALLEAACLVKLKHQVIGFGPFTFWRISLFPGAFGIRLNRFLQNGAVRGIPILRSAGSQYLVLGQKK